MEYNYIRVVGGAALFGPISHSEAEDILTSKRKCRRVEDSKRAGKILWQSRDGVSYEIMYMYIEPIENF